MRAHFLGSGVIMAFVFLMLAAAVMRMIGLASTSYWVTLVFAAGVMAGGAYAILFFVWLAIHVWRRILNRRPIMEVED